MMKSKILFIALLVLLAVAVTAICWAVSASSTTIRNFGTIVNNPQGTLALFGLLASVSFLVKQT